MSLEQTRRRHQAVETVHEIVSAMRAIAAGRIQGAQHALEGARRYHDVVLRAMALVLADSGLSLEALEDHRARTLLVMTSEQPFCGSFNPDIIDLVERRWAELDHATHRNLLVVGHRGARQLAARGLVAHSVEPAATSLEGIHDLVKRLALLIGHRYASGEVGELFVLYNRYQSVSEQVPTEVRLLPPDLDAIRRHAPGPGVHFQHNLNSSQLLSGLVNEYAFISLYLLAAESYTSEQASRLVAMDASTRNTEHMLQSLSNRERRERQDQITREVLDLIGARFASDTAG